MFDRMLDCAGAGTARRAGLTILATVAMAPGVVACGSDDSGGSSGQPAQVSSESEDAESKVRSEDYGIKTPDPTLRSGDDEDQVRYLLADIQSDYIVGNGAGYCSSLAAVSRKQLADLARAYGHGDTCEDFVTVTSKLTRNSKVKQKPTVTLTVRVDGDRAVARVSDGGRAPVPVTLVKRDGGWKILDRGFKAGLSVTGPPPS